MNEFFGGVLARVLAVLAGGVAGFGIHRNLLWLLKLMDPVAKRQARLIQGSWTAIERFSDDKSQAQYKLTLVCRGAQVTGTQSYISGRADKKETFDLNGSFENLTLNFAWTKKGSIETGTATLRYVDDKRLVGHELCVVNQKVFTSVVAATRD